MSEISEEKIFEGIRKALREDDRTQEQLAELIGCSQSFISVVKNGKQSPGIYYRRMCEVLGLDANTGLPLNNILPDNPHLPEVEAWKDPDQRRAWLQRIDLRQLGINPPPGTRSESSAPAGAMADTEQLPYTMTGSQVEVILAMIERRYVDALSIITEIMQGKRPH